MKRVGLIVSIVLLATSISAQQRHLVLWDNDSAPHSNGLSGEAYEQSSGAWRNTTQTDMWIFEANPERKNGKAIVYFPGGGYYTVGTGFALGKRFADAGYTVACVRYRLPNGHSEIPLEDAEEALRVMRTMADEMGFDSSLVGVMGTSAGGYLAASLSVLSLSKPSFSILIYPVISSDKAIRHEGTFINLLGPEDANDPCKAELFSLDKRVDAATPPAVLIHCDDDKVVPPVNSTLYYNALKSCGTDAALYVFPSGGHGWSARKSFEYYDEWFAAVTDWLDRLPAPTE
ncbi:MAG: alpha/beta hydrolase [Alistipes sp.]|nr:alpha/beta hydrolase [Alistipes sp.]